MALSKLAIRRLTKLADYMDSLPRSEWKHFDMQETSFHGCKIAACACGWGERVPGFKSAGYSFHDSADFFEISEYGHNSEWGQLFYSKKAFECKTPKQWARHCRKFIKDNR